MGLSVVILAAGQGTRMRSARPKVLHPLAGRPLVEHVCSTARALPGSRVHIVYGHGGDQLQSALGPLPDSWVLQAQQLGTGHAVQQALPAIPDEDDVLILYGDVPLTTRETLEQLIETGRGSGFGLVTVELPDPAGYGRIVRDSEGRVTRIVEHKDATEVEREIREINTGIMALPATSLKRWLGRLDNRNAQGEYYLTDVVALAVAEGVSVETVAPESVFEVMGVNTRAQLAELERYYQLMQAQYLMREGVSLADPMRFDLRGELSTGQDVFIDVNVVIEGRVVLGDRVQIGPACCLRDSVLGDDVVVLSHSIIDGARIDRGCRIGPFARIRPETTLAEAVHVGNFVEIKKSAVAADAKINHLSYVGDADVGARTNIGAGTITCNYDGANKHRTIIGADVFIGSDTQLVAPVTVGDGATIGAGTTVTDDAPPGALTVGRARQRTVTGWKRPTRDRS